MFLFVCLLYGGKLHILGLLCQKGSILLISEKDDKFLKFQNGS